MTNKITLTFDWNELEAQLNALADGPDQLEMIPHLVSGIKKQKPFLSEELLLQEILSIAACIADARFPAAVSSTSTGMVTSHGSESSPRSRL